MKAERVHQLTAHSAALYALAVGNESNTLFSGGSDKVVALWNIEDGEVLPFAIRTEETIYSLCNINDMYLCVGTIRGSIHIIDLKSKSEIKHLKLHDDGVFHLLFDPISNRVYASSADGSISIWDVQDWTLLWHLKLGADKVRRLALNGDSSLLAITGGNGKLFILETTEHRIIHEVEAHELSTNSVAFLGDSKIVSGGKDAYIRIWNLHGGMEMVKEIPAHNYAVYDIVVNQSDGWVATASRDKTLKIWDLEFEELPLRLDRAKADGHINSVNRLLWIPESGVLASCSDDRSIITWKIQH
ncbi:MAG: WD40 repeat domain-containing protein [Flavobacteriales bacterium]|nr:WD40 repeat domain-containing protein [Flavobacteriales bacterium]